MSESSSSSQSSESSSSQSSESSSVDICADGLRRIQLVPEFQSNFYINKHHGFRLKVTATNNCQMEAEIFRYYRYPLAETDGKTIDEFTGICSWPDMTQLPASAPRDTDSPQAFRLAYFDIVVNTEDMATEVWNIVQNEVAELVATMNAGDVLEAEASVWIGPEPTN